jgi:hypothetical protein
VEGKPRLLARRCDDPSNPNHPIAGTGETNQCGDCYVGAGIMVSVDGAQSRPLQNPGGVFGAGEEGVDIAQVANAPTNFKHEFVATTSVLFITSDEGASWANPSDASYAALELDILGKRNDTSSIGLLASP